MTPVSCQMMNISSVLKKRNQKLNVRDIGKKTRGR